MIDLRHPLAVLSQRMPWQVLEASISHHFSRKAKVSKKAKQLDMSGESIQVKGGGISNAGRPRLPLRLMIGLLYLKHAFDESDEGVVARWAETPTWQYFCGMEYFEHGDTPLSDYGLVAHNQLNIPPYKLFNRHLPLSPHKFDHHSQKK